MNKWYVIGKKYFIDEVTSSEYFKKDMGMSNTMVNSKTKDREMREDTFSTWYYNKYKRLLFKTGKIGNIEFFIDYYLKDDVVGFFLDKDLENHQYSKGCDIDDIKEKGINQWISITLKELDETLDFVKRENEKEINKDSGTAEKLFTDPGNVSWKDIIEYQKRKNKI